eukprot:3189753-Pleurochrysis_carterae.AAC.1
MLGSHAASQLQSRAHMFAKKMSATYFSKSEPYKGCAFEEKCKAYKLVLQLGSHLLQDVS